MKIQILEIWEKNAFLGMRNAYQLRKLREFWLYVEKPSGK